MGPVYEKKRKANKCGNGAVDEHFGDDFAHGSNEKEISHGRVS